MSILMTGYFVIGFRICIDINYELCFLTRGLGLVYKRNSTEFSIDFQKLKNLEIVPLGWVLDSFFSNKL